MNKIVISLMVILLVSACKTPQPGSPDSIWNGLNLVTGTKCPSTPPVGGDCVSGDVVAEIDVDANGAPISVDAIVSCEGKKVTWKYKNDFPNGDAPAFFIIFDPSSFPGNSSYEPISKAKPNSNNALNQELSIHTRKMKNAPECLNYMIVTPDKGVLDPVFIIKK